MNRRNALKSIGSGFGMMAFAEMLGSTALYGGLERRLERTSLLKRNVSFFFS